MNLREVYIIVLNKVKSKIVNNGKLNQIRQSYTSKKLFI